MKLMLVDDCQTTRKLLGLYLKAKGYDLCFAENGIDAIEKLAINSINLIITDLNMPYMNGLELTKALRADPNWRHVPILMVTTEADDEERRMAYEAGVDGYLVKPITADMMTQKIREILKNIFQRGV